MAPPVGRDVGDMLVVGPTGRRVRLPCADGLTYPGHGTAVARTVFDALLHAAAVDAGATPFVGRAQEPLEEDGRIVGYRLSTGETLYADFVIGADGATSEVARGCGSRRSELGSVGFCRAHVPATGGRSPGHRLVGADALGARSPATAGSFRGSRTAPTWGWALGPGQIARPAPMPFGRWPISSRHLRALGLLDEAAPSVPPRRLGGWLKMGIVGTTPARGRVLLVGDAAGLVNPMQGEGISQAHDQRSCCRGGDTGEAQPRSRELSIQTCRRTPAVSSDRRCSARRTGRAAPGNCSGRAASYRGGPRRCAYRRLGRFLERTPRWCAAQSASFGGERGDTDRPSLDRTG